jgi:3-oxoadipate enol-lactonase
MEGTHRTAGAPAIGFRVEGRGTPVVLSHALGVDMRMWDTVAADLARDHEVLRYDHRGHGASGVPRGPYTLDAMVDDAVAVIDAWGRRSPVVFVGLSLGGMVAQGLALRHPALLRGVVIANSGARYPEPARQVWAQRIATVERDGVAAVVDATMERWFTPAFRAERPEVVARFRAAVLQTDPAGYLASCHAVAAVDWLDQLPQVKCPTLVIAGAQDVGAPPAMSQAIAERIPGATLKIFDEVAHMSAVEQPERFVATLRSFIAARCGG